MKHAIAPITAPLAAPMTALLTAAALALAPAPVAAQNEQEPDPLKQGAELFAEGLGLMLRGLGQKLETPVEGWTLLFEWIEDFSAYDLPEMLPNGDIIIRRKEPLESEVEL